MISNITLNSTTPPSSNTTTQSKYNADGIKNVSRMDDKVLMSDSAKLVAQMLEDNQSPEDMDRIMQLQHAIHTGTYNVDAEIIADKLLRDAEEF